MLAHWDERASYSYPARSQGELVEGKVSLFQAKVVDAIRLFRSESRGIDQTSRQCPSAATAATNLKCLIDDIGSRSVQ
jgi:hypothetical protein